MAEVEKKQEKTISLKPLDVSDSQKVFNLFKTDRHILQEWTDDNFQSITEKEFTEFITQEIKSFEMHNDFLYTVCNSRSLLGIAGFYFSSKFHNKTEIVIWLSFKERTDINYSAIIKELLEIGFTKKDYHRIGIRVWSGDLILSSVLRKSGFKIEGTERNGYLNLSNTYSDITLLGLLQKEYIDQQSFFLRADKLFKRSVKTKKK